MHYAVLLVLFVFSFSLNAQQWNWAVSAGGESNNDHVLGIASDSEGNFYGVGTVRGTAGFGCASLAPGNSDGGFLAKYNAAGQCQWVRGITTNGIGVWVNDIAIDADDNVYIVGYFRGNTDFGSGITLSGSLRTWFLARYDTDGNCIWVKPGGNSSSSSHATALTVGNDGTVYVTGWAIGNTFTFAPLTISNPNTSSTQLVVVAYDSTGTAQWARCSAGAGYDNKLVNSIALAGDRLFLTGRIGWTVASYDGVTLGPTASNAHLYVLACDLEGNALWANHYAGNHEGMAVAADSLGNLWVGGRMWGTLHLPDDTLVSVSNNDDIILIGMDQEGNYRWGHSTGSTDRDLLTDVVPDGMGNAYVVGYFEQTVNFLGAALSSLGEHDVIIGKVRANGDLIWANRAGGTGNGNIDRALCLHRRPTAPYTLSFGGYYWGSVTYGSTTIDDVLNGDAMLVSGVDTSYHTSTHTLPVCPGSCEGVATAFAHGQGPFTYVWSNGANTASIGDLCVGEYYVAITDANDSMQVDTVRITTRTDPGYTVEQLGTLLLVDGGYAWQWFLDDQLLPDAGATLIAEEVGDYHVVVTDANGCTWSSDTVSVINTGITGAQRSSWSVYPNPVAHFLTIEHQGTAALPVELIDATGRTVMMRTLEPNVGSFSVQGLRPGLYLLRTSDGRQAKVLVE